jgi:hypothetical protein
VTIAPDDPRYCEHCNCREVRSPPSCPKHDWQLCTLPNLQREIPYGPYAKCGPYVLYEEGGFDHSETWLFNASNGSLVAWRGGGGIMPFSCKDGYRTYWNQWPARFVFPKREDCEPTGYLYGE